MRMRPAWSLLVLALAVGAAACTTEPPDEVPSGTWGGDGAKLVATPAGASVNFNCANGEVNQQLIVGAAGDFSWSGTYTRVFPAPGTPPDSPHAATYHGTAGNTQLSLSVTVPDLAIASEPVTLTLGDPGNLVLCP
jgi:hypothetical protein